MGVGLVTSWRQVEQTQARLRMRSSRPTTSSGGPRRSSASFSSMPNMLGCAAVCATKAGAFLNRRCVRCCCHAHHANTSDPRAAPACLVLVVALLREHLLLALRANGTGAGHHPMGAGGVQRPAEAVGKVLSMWSQGCVAAAPWARRRRHRAGTVSRRSPGRPLTAPPEEGAWYRKLSHRRPQAVGWYQGGRGRSRPSCGLLRGEARGVPVPPASEPLPRHGCGTDGQP
jgi:hypothetical protein